MQGQTANNSAKGKRRFYFLIYLVACMLLFMVQLILGTDFIIAVEALISLLLAGYPLYRFGLYDIVALFAFGLLSKYSVLPFLIKTVMGERIDIGLLAVDKTFSVILVGSILTVAALLLSKTIHIKKRILNFSLSNKQLQVLGYVAYGFGFGLSFLHILMTYFSITEGVSKGFGGFGGFIGLLYLGIICTTAYVVKTDPRRSLNKSILLMLTGSLYLSLIGDAKLYFTLSVLAYIATLFLFGRKVSLRYIVGGLLLAAFYMGALVPLIQVLRTDNFKEVTLQQRVDMVLDFAKHHLFESHDAAALSALLFHYDYYPKLHTPIINRLEMVQDLDQVLDGVNNSNTIGWEPIPMALKQITPHFLEPNKTPYVDVDIIDYRTGITHILMANRQTLGIFGVSYAMFMWPGWIFLSFFLMVIFFLLIRKLVPYSALGNIFGIYLLVKYGNYFSELSVQALISVMLRDIPQDVVTIFILFAIIKALVRKNRKHYRPNTEYAAMKTSMSLHLLPFHLACSSSKNICFQKALQIKTYFKRADD